MGSEMCIRDSGQDLAGEVDGEADEQDHAHGGGDHPHGDRATLSVGAGASGCAHRRTHRSRWVSRGERTVAVMFIDPGRAGMTPARSRRQVTVAPTEAGVPTGLAKPEVSTVTLVARHRVFCAVRLEVAAVRALDRAEAWVREMEAARQGLERMMEAQGG